MPIQHADPATRDGAEVVSSLGSDPELGLSSGEAAARLAQVGPNRLVEEARTPAWRRYLEQFNNPLIYLLLGSIVVSLIAWYLEGAEGVPVEAVVIALVVVLNATFGFIQEDQAEQAVEALQQMVAPTSRVVRDGIEQDIPSEQLVPGDIHLVAEGDAVGADGRLVRCASLTIAEASLTGESEPVLKDAAPLTGPAPLGDRVNMVFSGTSVTRGRGRAVVTATGMATEMGRIATMLGETKQEPTPLQREMSIVGETLARAVVVIAVVVVAAILATSPIDQPSDLVDVLLIGVALAVAAVPEGLPATLTVVLSIGVQRMAGKNAIVKRLSSVETLGSASAICTDKTGTLTRNEMTIQRIVTRSGEVEVSGIGYLPEGRLTVDGRALGEGSLRDEVWAVLGGGSIAGNAALTRTDEGGWSVHGDPTEVAFVVADRKLALSDEQSGRFMRRGEIPFSSERKLMSAIHADRATDGELLLTTKGAPDILLARCTHELVGLEAVPLTAERRAGIQATIDRLADAALRTLGVAHRRLPADPSSGQLADDSSAADESLEHDLVFAGVVGMIDPPRPEVAASIEEARDAGIRVLMVTGDHARTAGRIAETLGIARVGEGQPSVQTLAGTDIDQLDEPSLLERSRTASVYARVAPEHKLRIVDALQADGNIVAMTGDGVNDAPALKSADIGVAMGITGTAVAKEAADMILADDNFATIIAAVREGRGIFANIQRFMRYLLSSNVGEVLTMFVGVVAAPLIGLHVAGGDVAAPLLATQILWINLVTDSGPAIALGFDPPPDDVMKRPPRKLTDRVIDGPMRRTILLTGATMAAATLFALDLGLPGGLVPGTGSLDHARTMAFTVSVMASLLIAYSSRSTTQSAFRGLLRNPRLTIAVVVSLGLQVLVVHVPILNTGFGTTPLSVADWLACGTIASTVLWVEELRKLVARRWRRRA